MQNHFQKYSSEVKSLSNQQLLFQTKFLVQKERNLHIQVLHHLEEIDSRKLYLEQGFSSLFDYAVKELGYSEGAAYRRIKAMKLCRDVPETEDRLKSGRLSLSSACQLQAFFEKKHKKEKMEKLREREGIAHQKEGSKNEESVLKSKSTTVHQKSVMEDQPDNRSCRSLSIERKQELVKKVEGCSTRATMKLLSEEDSSLLVPKEQTRFLGKGKVEIKAVIDESCHKKLEELKNLLSHKNPSLSYGELLSILSEEALEKHDPIRKRTKKGRMKEKAVTSAPKWNSQQTKKIVTSAPKWSSPQTKKIVTSAPKWNSQQTKKAVTSAPKWSSPQTKKAVTSAPKSKTKKLSRAIPAELKRHIWKRDEGQCSYVHPETKRRCGSKHLLQIDHIKPFSLGGKSELSNLRLLCAGHNRFRSERTFGNTEKS